MNKKEYRKHCEEQIERCIKLHDSKHLREYKLSLALLNECERRKQREENLIKYLEDKMNEIRIGGCDCLTTKMFETEKRVYREVLEKVKSGKYE